MTGTYNFSTDSKWVSYEEKKRVDLSHSTVLLGGAFFRWAREHHAYIRDCFHHLALLWQESAGQ